MKSKGFTLIELLAVIVILAIIALIATPIILNIIEDAKEESAERSAENYLEAVELAVAKENLNGEFNPESCTIVDNGYLECEGYAGTIKVEVDGEVPEELTGSKITFNEGKVTGGNFKISGTNFVIEEGTLKKGTQTTTPTVVKLCTANTTKATALVWQGNDDPGKETSYAREEVGLLASEDGAYTTGVAYTCNFIDDNETNNMTFFVLSSTENEVTLISGSNLGGFVAWCSDETKCKTNGSWDNTKGPITANAALLDRTSNWSIKNGGKLNDTQMETIKLPTKDQIEGAYEGTMPKWLYTHPTTPIAYGYWTASFGVDFSNSAWYVSYDGYVNGNSIYDASGDGVRPVITISKSVLE